VSALGAALKIIWQSFGYRVRKREANNLAVTATMMLAFHMPFADIAYRVVYALVLNIYVYLVNDFWDISVDLGSRGKDQEKTRFMAANRGAAVGAVLGLAALLLIGALVHSRLLVIAFVINTVMIHVYSSKLKKVPIADLLMMALAGASMTMVGLPDKVLGWKLLGLLSLLSACYEVIQVIRDEPEDRAKGVRTTAVLLGSRTSAWIYRAIMAGAAAYGFWIVGSPVCLALVLAAPLPLTPERASRSWDLARLVTGSVWLALMAQLYLGYL
jgi:4-hydroxybenzoate polyprenyltransferase